MLPFLQKCFRTIIVRRYENNNVKYFTDDRRWEMFEHLQSLNYFQNLSTCLSSLGSFANKKNYDSGNLLKLSSKCKSPFMCWWFKIVNTLLMQASASGNPNLPRQNSSLFQEDSNPYLLHKKNLRAHWKCLHINFIMFVVHAYCDTEYYI